MSQIKKKKDWQTLMRYIIFLSHKIAQVVVVSQFAKTTLISELCIILRWSIKAIQVGSIIFHRWHVTPEIKIQSFFFFLSCFPLFPFLFSFLFFPFFFNFPPFPLLFWLSVPFFLSLSLLFTHSTPHYTINWQRRTPPFVLQLRLTPPTGLCWIFWIH